jgi:hypothetical protein
MPDGRRFVFTRAIVDGRTVGTGSFSRLAVVIVQNWAEGLAPVQD